jgi:hypothetical protein
MAHLTDASSYSLSCPDQHQMEDTRRKGPSRWGDQLLLAARGDADSHNGSATRLRVADRHEITDRNRKLMRQIIIGSTGN